MANPFAGPKGGTTTATRPKASAVAVADPEDEGGAVTMAIKPKDPFAMPGGGGSGYKITEFEGELLLIKPIERDVIDTEISANSDVIRCDVVRLENQNEQVEDMLVFQTALRRTLGRVLDGPNEWVLGRLGRGTAKKGKSAPWILTTPDESEAVHAGKVMAELGLT
ncbi:Uncharacterised protein [Mycobacteroides abscessus subsp. massiliense]|uniref:hypothetical protein n=1 Tax=Mycobacteroides abscessus TaxID=36809 RepID=UPI0002585B73|nr:hypothetical protein [Mycobacteroides abscessus]EIC63585.1 hypothetical protein OUW_20416 [Mycobacteroides abscessus M93]RIR62917.1 hypothetical protein D2E33_04350 [Mycobacteroides abscessus]SKN10612.1 Uncharacterised protein [Mycobacteroides abscessus subsp. massiliense]SKT21846.1 Uncharacterised protein [Mycobacteroides abscessus subsp. bolletii]SLF56727.1 Uncharacterised protein [Mycobacteroides abscessus subsp. bolletii]